MLARMPVWVARLAAFVAVVGMAACGGGGDAGPTQLPQKTISGTVVSAGKALANAPVYAWCFLARVTTGQVPNDNAVLTFYTVTDTNGSYSVRADSASAPCIIEAQDSVNGTTLHSYVAAFDSSAVTANITPITDAVLALTLGTSNFNTVTGNLPSWTKQLSNELPKGTDVSAWNSMRTQLLSGTYIKATADVNAMPTSPVTGALTLSTATPTPAGYFSLLQKLDAANMDSNVLQSITQGERFVVVPGSNGAEVLDLRNKWVWQRCVMGMVWTGTTCSGTPSYLTWSEANAAVAKEPISSASKQRAKWFMPSTLLLRQLLTSQGATSSMDPTWFPNDPGWWTWAGPTFNVPYLASVLNTQSGVQGITNSDGSLFRAPSSAPPTTSTGKFMVRLFRVNA